MKHTRRDFLYLAGAAAVAGVNGIPAAAAEGEWRNKQSGMSYRRLGRTGFMVSEFICGGNTIKPGGVDHVRLAVDMGLNYLDTAPAYGRGQSELGYAEVLKGSSNRQRVFVATKVSAWDNNRNQIYRKIYDSLPESEQKAIKREAEEAIADRRAKDPDYLINYFDQQVGELDAAALANIMEKRYGTKIDKRKEYMDLIVRSVEESLQRLGTDYVDVLLCPHGANTPAELNVPEVFEAFERLKKSGKARHLGFSSHTDPGGTLRAAVDSGKYDMGMVAYNVINHEYVDKAIAEAKKKDVGVVAMKSARAVWPGRDRPVAPHRLEKINRAVPGDMKLPMKAYLWVLQNPNIAGINSEMITADMVRDNLPLAGRKI